jgi:hypothetical protein
MVRERVFGNGRDAGDGRSVAEQGEGRWDLALDLEELKQRYETGLA